MDIINGAINVVPSVEWKKRKTYLAFIQYLTGANQKKKILTKNGKNLLKNMTNENIKVSLPAQIVKVETLADNGFKVVVVTNELLPEQAAFLFSLKGSAGWVGRNKYDYE